MGHGYPDYGVAAPKDYLYAGVDLGELAARLGAFSRYDRLGDVVFLDGFEGDLGAWEIDASGTLASAAVTADRKATGGFSLKVVGGSTDGWYTTFTGRLPVPYSTIYGWEWQWTLDDNLDYAHCLVSIYTGKYLIMCGIKYDLAAEQNYYYNALGGWTAIGATQHPYISDHNFISAKFTFDISTQKYKRFLVPPLTFDIQDCAGYIFGDLSYPRMEIEGKIASVHGENAVSYLDSFIVTANDQ